LKGGKKCAEINLGCIHPKQLKGEFKDCSAEQIAICHPREKGQPCEMKEGKKEL
jgi:hypothetical protein